MLRKLLLLLLLPVASHAQSTDYGAVHLLRGWQLADGSYQMALEFRLNAGWKTYWRSPGPAGLPPRFDWSASSNIDAVDISWPVPEVIDQGGMVTLGYHDSLVLPIHITPESDGPVRVALSLHFGVCADICVPAEAVFLARLDGSAEQGVALITAALATTPEPRESAGLSSITCAVSSVGEMLEITADLAFEQAINAPFTVIESGNADIWIDSTESQSEGTTISATAPMRFYGSGEMAIDRSALTVSVFGTERAVVIEGCAD